MGFNGHVTTHNKDISHFPSQLSVVRWLIIRKWNVSGSFVCNFWYILLNEVGMLFFAPFLLMSGSKMSTITTAQVAILDHEASD